MSKIELQFVDTLDASDARYKAPLLLSKENGYVPQNLSIGWPEVRDVVDKRPNANGTFDNTELYGSNAVIFSVGLASELATAGVDDDDLLDELKSWIDPARRTWLYYRRNSSKPWRKIKIRGQQIASALNFTRVNFDIVSVSARGVDGVSKGTTLVDRIIYPGGVNELGRTYDLAFDRSYPSSDPIGVSFITNEGTASVLPVVRIYGPCTQPRLENRSTGLKMEFLASYSIANGDYIEINFENGTVYLNGDTTNSRYDKIDFSVSSWFSLIPGVNAIRFYPNTFSPPAQAEVIFEPSFF